MSGTISSTSSVAEDRVPVWELVAVFLAPAFIFSNMYTTQAILPVLSQAFHISAPTAGLSVSVLVLAVAIGSLFYGPISDVVGRKPVMVWASFLVAIPTILCGFAPNFTTLVILRALQGLLMPGLTSVAIAYVNEEFQGKWRGLAMGIYVSGLVLGGLFSRVGSAALAGLYNWHIALEAFILPTLIAAFAIWRFLPAPPTDKQIRERSAGLKLDGAFVRQTLHDMKLHLRNRRLMGAFTIGFASFFGFIGVFTYLPYYLSGSPFHLSTISLGLVYLLWLTGVCSPAAGTIASRIGSRWAIALSTALASIGLLITLIPVLPVVIAGLSLVTLGMFSTSPSANLYLGEQATVSKGTAASLYLSLYYFGGSLGALLPGLALLWAGWPGVALLCLGMTLVAMAADIILCR
ncbi:MAG TPA: MFS transporter [Ktedonobacteraceae bacterium]|nr:MFS transporter [Ktedonobacteraceae bacterium]